MNDSFGIRRVLMTTNHAKTATQKVVDGVSGKDWRFGKGPREHHRCVDGAAAAVAKVLPALRGGLTGTAFPRSCIECLGRRPTCELERKARYEGICSAMRDASLGPMKGVLGYTEEEIVSTDVQGDACTCVFDAKAGIQPDPTFVKLGAWCDNEWGYSSKLLDLAIKVAT